MRATIVVIAILAALFATVVAQPRKVLVLPLDGNAPANQKSELNASLQRVARAQLAGDVTVGDTTFAETAAAVGCDPQSPDCADTVMSTLSVDELVYGDATTENGSTTVTVTRATRGAEPRQRVSVIAESDSADLAEPTMVAVFDETAAGMGSERDPAVPAVEPAPRGNFFDTRERKLGVGLAVGGAIAAVIGLSFWAGKSDIQDQIDNHPTRTLQDLRALAALEDRAGDKAMWGNIMVALGLGLGGAGAYYLYTDHKNRSATVTPSPVESGTGMTLVLRGRW